MTRQAKLHLHPPKLQSATALQKKISDLQSRLNGPSTQVWPERPDANLAADPRFSAAAMQPLVAQLTRQYADTYVSEIRVLLNEVDANCRLFSDIATKQNLYTIDRFAEDEAIAIHDREIAAGWYKLDYESAKADLESTAALKRGAVAVCDVLTDATAAAQVDQLLKDPTAVGHSKAAAAMIASVSPYHSVHWPQIHAQGEVKWRIFNSAVPDSPPEAIEAPPPMAPDTPRPASLAMYGATLNGYQCDAIVAASTITSNLLSWQANMASLTATENSRTIVANWASSDVGFRQERTQLQYDVVALKRAAFEGDGPQNLLPELNDLRERVRAGLVEILRRAMVCQEVLPALFGLPVPKLPSAETWTSKAPFVPELVAWLRGMDAALAVWSPRERATIVSISIKQQMGTKAWDALIKKIVSGNASAFECTFLAGAQAVGLNHPRLRALGCLVVSKGAVTGDYWSGNATCPAAAESRQSDGTVRPWRQPATTIDLARVHQFSAMRQPDFAGLSAVQNLCPVSAGSPADPATWWHISIARRSILGADFAADAADVVVQLMVVGQA